MEGRRFGRLVVQSLHSRDNNYNKRWLCRCDCGAEKVVLADKLKNGNTQSCGCFGKELRAVSIKKANEERRLYTKKSWQAMVGRCTNPKYPSYPRYGAIGVSVCERWLKGDGIKTGWLCFFEDMGPKPTGHSIDRIDNEKGYYPENCRWADKFQQAQNRRKKNSAKSTTLL